MDAPAFHAMVLAAGFGTRLRPLTDELPKPLVPLMGEPLLGTLLRELQSAGAGKIAVNVHHGADKIINFINRLDFKVHVSHEVRIRGTAGGIAGARPALRGAPVVVCNGDIVGTIPVRDLLEAHASGDSRAPLILAGTEAPSRKGTLGVDAHGNVVRLRGETFGREVRAIDYMGTALLTDECLEALPEEGCLIGDVALPLLRGGGVVATVTVRHPFEDIGSPEAYLEAHLRRLGDSSLVDSRAVVNSGVSIERCFIGANARVIGAGTVKACVILPGAQVRAPLEDVIVTPAGVVMSVSRELGTVAG